MQEEYDEYSMALDESDYQYMLESQIEGDGINDKDEKVQEFTKRNQNISVQLHQLNEDITQTLNLLDKTFTVFSVHFTKEIEGKKVNVKNKISRAILRISKEKLPEIYLRSIPKFRGNELTHALHTTLLKMKRFIDRNDRNNIVRYDQELKNEVTTHVKLTIQENYIDPRSMMHHLVVGTEDVINELKSSIEKLNENLKQLKRRNYDTISNFKRMKITLKKKQLEKSTLGESFKEEDEGMDEMRKTIKKKNEELEGQRMLFFEELHNVQTVLYEKEINNKPISEKDIPIGEFSMICMKKREEEKSEEMDLRTKLEIEANRKIKEMRAKFEVEKKKKFLDAEADFHEKEKTIEKLVKRIINMKKRYEKITKKPYKDL